MNLLKKIIVKINKANSIRQRKNKYKREIDLIFNQVYKTQKAVIVIGTVEYGNIGDQAICLAQQKFISKSMSIFEIRDSLYYWQRSYINSKMRDKDIIVIPGGGNMGNLWESDEKRRQNIIIDYPKNKIVVFPQSIFYTDNIEGDVALERSAQIYNSHKNLVLCARENRSFKLMKAKYKNCKVLLVPDIVLSLKFNVNMEERSGVLFCLRKDIEKAISEQIIQNLENIFFDKDFHIEYTDTVILEKIELIERNEVVTKKINEFAKYSIVVTDRLHGMIFCAITGTPCIVLPNNNYKVEGVYQQWLSKYSWIHYGDSDVEKFIDTVIKEEYQPINIDSSFKELQEELING